jgi:hypothetical protein
MKLITGWVVSAGLVLAVSAAHAQMVVPSDGTRSPYRATSDFDRPDAEMPPEPPAYRHGQGYYGQGYGPRYNQGYDQGYGPPLMPPQEVYAVLRENGFSPLGIPHQRGYVYTISAIDRAGEDGRVVIDARTGRILRFVPASRWGGNFEEDAPPPPTYGPQSALPPPTAIRGVPRPPASVPRVASQTVPMPKPAPTRPAPDSSQQSAAVAVPAKPIETPAATGTIGQAMPPTPVPLIRPTQAMPKMQDLE